MYVLSMQELTITVIMEINILNICIYLEEVYMDRLKHRIEGLIFRFNIDSSSGAWEKHPYTLDYEGEKYRQDELVKIIRDAVIHFALTEDEISSLKETDDFGEMSRKAWSRISKAKKNQKGDFGELLLFLMLVAFFPAQKFVTKVRLRSSMMDQIKGFDCAHFSVEDDKIYLWLGEAKFHSSFSNAISGAVESVEEHCKINYLKDEISILASNIEVNSKFKHYDKLNKVLNGSITLDKINIKIPVLLTYDCKLLKSHCDIEDENFIDEMEEEFFKKFTRIEKQNLKVRKNIELVFIILPLESVQDIKNQLEKIEEANR